MKNTLKSTLYAALLAVVLPASVKADDNQLWAAFLLNGPVSDDNNFLVWFDGHARFRDDASDLGVSIIRPGVGWRMNDTVSLWAGYARVISRSDTAPDVKENRIWQQATYNIGSVLGGSLAGRTRLEQRLLNTGDDTGWRARQFLRYSRPFANDDYSFIAWNELFIAFNDTDWGARSGYDQSRTFVGAGWQMRDNLRFEGGYMLNHINRSNGPNATNHVLSISLVAAL